MASQSFQCQVAIGFANNTWQQCTITAVTDGSCGNIASQVEQSVKQGLTQPYVFVTCYSVTPL